MRDKRVIASSIVCCVASAFGLLAGTIAWFSMNNEVSVNNVNVQVENESFGYASFNAKPVSRITNTVEGKQYTFADEEAMELPCFDKSGLIYSQWERALLIDITFVPYSTGRYSLLLFTEQPTFTIE